METHIEARNQISSYLFQWKATLNINLIATYDLILHMQNNSEDTIHSLHALVHFENQLLAL